MQSHSSRKFKKNVESNNYDLYGTKEINNYAQQLCSTIISSFYHGLNNYFKFLSQLPIIGSRVSQPDEEWTKLIVF